MKQTDMTSALDLEDVCANRKTHLTTAVLYYLGNSQQHFCHHFETGFKSPGRILNLKQIVQKPAEGKHEPAVGNEGNQTRCRLT